jgi:hypothetical protein
MNINTIYDDVGSRLISVSKQLPLVKSVLSSRALPKTLKVKAWAAEI